MFFLFPGLAEQGSGGSQANAIKAVGCIGKCVLGPALPSNASGTGAFRQGQDSSDGLVASSGDCHSSAGHIHDHGASGTRCAGHAVSDVGRRPVRADLQPGWLLARPSVGEHQLAGAALLGIEARGTREQANLLRKATVAVVALNPHATRALQPAQRPVNLKW